MKILVFHQPEPVGNYHAHTFIANKFTAQGHDTYLLEQLHGREYDDAYVEQINSLDPDVIYIEMLDINTFEVVSKIKRAKKVLFYCSKGVLDTFDSILDYHGKWYDSIITNSAMMHKKFLERGIESEFTKYYYLQLSEDDLGYVSEYDHVCAFLGIGFGRVNSPTYELERNLYFNNMSLYNECGFTVYGNGWPNGPFFKGVLPYGHIGKLYSSIKSSISLIEPHQRTVGMINNRYVELAYCQTPYVTYNYDGVDWFGAEKYMNFISSPSEVVSKIKEISKNPDSVIKNTEELKKIMIDNDIEFFQKLEQLFSK